MTRKLGDWLTGYLRYVENSESPISYHTWAGVAMICGTLQRRVHMRWGLTTIYPNEYIILVGPSGQSRKAEPINIARQFLEHVGLQVSAQSTTIQMLLRSMAGAITDFKDERGRIKFQSAMTCLSEELAVLLGSRDITRLAVMTDIYDCSGDRWKNETKWAGVDDITGACLNMIGATAPDWLPSIFPSEAVGGGFTSRAIFIVEEYKGKTVEDPEENPPDDKLKATLLSDLQEIRLLVGPYEFTKEAREKYKQWYRLADEDTRRGKPAVADPKFAGYCSRRATHIKKICMAVSASRGDDMMITERDFERSRILLEDAEKRMSKAFRGMGKAKHAEATEAVLGYIIRHKTAKRSEILQAYHRDIDAWMLDQIEIVLEQMKVIKITIKMDERDKIYTYTDVGQS